MNLDAAFWPALWQLATETGTRPETLLAVWFAESGLDPRAKNPTTACIGLNQTCPSSIGGPGFPNDDPNAYQNALASEQLAWIAPQVRRAVALNRGPFLSAARYYQSNWLPATLAGAKAPRDVIAGKAGPYAVAYAANAGLDVSRDGVVTLDDLGRYLELAIGRAPGVLESAIATAYARTPVGARWATPSLALFEPTAAPAPNRAAGAAGGLLAVVGLALTWLLLRRGS